MTLRTFIDKNGNSWEWEETEELIKAVKELHNQNETQNDTKTTDVG
jgi:hypothetical protein